MIKHIECIRDPFYRFYNYEFPLIESDGRKGASISGRSIPRIIYPRLGLTDRLFYHIWNGVRRLSRARNGLSIL